MGGGQGLASRRGGGAGGARGRRLARHARERRSPSHSGPGSRWRRRSEARTAPRATRAPRAPRVPLPRGPRPPPRVPHRVVVLDGQPGDGGWARLRLPAHAVPQRAGATRGEARLRVGRARGLHGALRALGHRRRALPRLRALQPRGALGLAGAQTQPFQVWLEDWKAEAVGRGVFPLRLSAEAAAWRCRWCWSRASRRCSRETGG